MQQFRKFLPQMGAIFKFISTYWKGVFTVATLPGLVVSAWYSEKRKTDQVMKRLKDGSMLHLETHSKRFAERKQELTKLKETILSTEATEGRLGLFFIVAGPNGCGKSWLMKTLCHQNPKGMIYFQVYDSKSFPVGIGRACGMSFEMQGNIWQTIVGWGNLPYKSWYVLPKSTEAALSYVFEVLEKHGQALRSKDGKIPTIIIDSVDIIEKTDPELFKHLIRLTKRVANDGSLNIVLVSSEGHVVPTVKSLSEKSRVKILYQKDLTEKEAIKMLERKFDKDLSERLLRITGPRLQYIKRVQTTAHICGFPKVSNDSTVKCVSAELVKEAQDCMRQAQATKAGETFEAKKKILQHVLEKNEDSRCKIECEVSRALPDKKLEIPTCLQDLLRGNVLTIEDDKIRFHSKLLKIYAKKYLETDDERPIEL